MPYKLDVSPDKMKAWLSSIEETDNQAKSSEGEVIQWLAEHGIIYGIKKDIIAEILDQVYFSKVLIANGVQPIKGENGKLLSEVTTPEKDDKTLNLRNVLQIPSVHTGQLIASILPPGIGKPGMNILGQSIPAQEGKALRIKNGKNTIVHANQIFSTTEGQISLSENMIQVNPVFDVKGDLDLSVGNIDFVGNVTIKGNVPPGYTIRCGGDLRIGGMVEGSILDVGGSILISGGIAGENKSIVKAGGNIQTLYINQTIVEAGQNIEVGNSILHSTINSGGFVIVKKGHVIGGTIRANKRVILNDAGNFHYARTTIIIGEESILHERRKQLEKEANDTKQTISKLTMIADKLQDKLRAVGELTQQEKLLLQKQQNTSASLHQKWLEIKEEIRMIDYSDQVDDHYLSIHGTAYPNVFVTIGKYSKHINHAHNLVKLSVKQGGISVEPL